MYSPHGNGCGFDPDFGQGGAAGEEESDRNWRKSLLDRTPLRPRLEFYPPAANHECEQGRRSENAASTRIAGQLARSPMGTIIIMLGPRATVRRIPCRRAVAACSQDFCVHRHNTAEARRADDQELAEYLADRNAAGYRLGRRASSLFCSWL